VFTFSADSFKSLEQWIHYLTVCSLEYIQAMLSSSTDHAKVEEKAEHSGFDGEVAKSKPEVKEDQPTPEINEEHAKVDHPKEKSDGKKKPHHPNAKHKQHANSNRKK
jgi:outer membrane biosynthesis protein TonB